MVDFSPFPALIVPAMRAHPAVRSLRRQPRLWRDTTNFTAIDYGDVIELDDRFFLVVGYTREGRFGIDEQPKQWVPKVLDLVSGEHLLLKLAFYENYQVRIGTFQVTCYRSPEKEARVIDLMQGNRNFMQGYSSRDAAGNIVRVLQVIRGKRLDRRLAAIDLDHQSYCEVQLRGILTRFLTAVDAICLLHQHRLTHGDIRRDHIFVDNRDGHYRWIDFDYDFHLPERPFALDLFGLGNVLLYIVGRKNYRPWDVREHPQWGRKVLDTLDTGDLSLVSGDRIFNLRKLFPYIPESLNNILLRFSAGSRVTYETAREFHDDLADWLAS